MSYRGQYDYTSSYGNQQYNTPRYFMFHKRFLSIYSLMMCRIIPPVPYHTIYYKDGQFFLDILYFHIYRHYHVKEVLSILYNHFIKVGKTFTRGGRVHKPPPLSLASNILKMMINNMKVFFSLLWGGGWG